MRAPVKLYLASSNPGKLDEFRALADWTRSSANSAVSEDLPVLSAGAGGSPPTASDSPEIEFALVPGFAVMPEFEENAPTFAENALGKALYYSQLWAEQIGGLDQNAFVFADDSGLVVPALDGAPGVKSARYAGPNATAAQRNDKLLNELSGKTGAGRAAHFVCVIALVGRTRRRSNRQRSRRRIDSRCTNRQRRIRLRSGVLFHGVEEVICRTLTRREKPTQPPRQSLPPPAHFDSAINVTVSRKWSGTNTPVCARVAFKHDCELGHL